MGPPYAFCLSRVYLVKCDVTPRLGCSIIDDWKLNCINLLVMDSSVLLSSPPTQGRRVYLHRKATVKTRCEILNPLWASPIHCQPGRENSWEKKKQKNSTVLSQSCRHVYCMTILEGEFWCFVNFELFEHCVCVTESRRPSFFPTATPTPPLSSWAKSEHKAQSFIIYIWLPNPDALMNLWST